MMAGSALFDLIPPDVPADIARHLLPRLLGQMRAYPISDYLLDIGTMSNYEKAQTTWPGENPNVWADERERQAIELSTVHKYGERPIYGESS
jgi:NDP-sugar pyrophosphorylase family protein